MVAASIPTVIPAVQKFLLPSLCPGLPWARRHCHGSRSSPGVGSFCRSTHLPPSAVPACGWALLAGNWSKTSCHWSIPPHGAGLQGLAVPPALGGRCCQPDQVSCRHVSPQGPAPPPASLSLLMLQIHLLRRDGEENAPQSLYTHCKEGLNYTTSLAWYPTNMRTFIYS